jgi:hypothetical protein
MNPFSIAALVASGIGLWLVHRGIEGMFRDEKARSRSPFGEKLLRPPGESLRLRIDDLKMHILEKGMIIALFIFLPVILFLLIPQRSGLHPVSLTVSLLGSTSGVCYAAAYFHWRKFKVLRRELRNCWLGFDGERYMAEKLTPLVGKGYRVFHDLQVDWLPGMKFNIDHIAVGSNGVFVIETKTRRKRNGALPGGTEDYKMQVSGGMLHFPQEMPTDEPLKQAKTNADVLARRLAGTSKSAVPVFAVVALPGWWVDEEEYGEVRVVSGRAIASRLPAFGEGGILSEQEILRLSDLLDRDCRNVEG